MVSSGAYIIKYKEYKLMKKQILSVALSTGLLLAFSGQVMASSSAPVTSGSIDLTNTAPNNANVTPFSVSLAATSAGGGSWDEGTSLSGIHKKVYSNYNHNDYVHSSSCTIGTQSSHSGDTKAGLTSYSSAIGGLSDETHAYWKVNWVPKS
jgi:lactococcin 972 family bacteriocin